MSNAGRARVDRYAWLAFTVVAALSAAGLIVQARAKPFWHDEIYTILHASLPNIGVMWRASLDGIDLLPPLNSFLTHAVHSLTGVGLVTTRLVPMLGYLSMTAIVFQLVRTRSNTITALASAVLPVFTAAYAHGYEARGYGLMVGLAAAALFAWSEAARGRNRRWMLPLLSVALAAGLWNHYYGVFVFVPIAVGEAARAIQRRRLDVGIAVACLAAIALAAPLYSLAATAAPQAKTFWTQPRRLTIRTTYGWLLRPMVTLAFGLGAAAIAAVCLFLRTPRSERQEARTLPAHEVVAGLAMLGIPVLCVAIVAVARAPFAPRYAMAMVVGLSLVLPLAVWQRHTRGGIGERLMTTLLALAFLTSVGPTLVSRPSFQDPYLGLPVLRQAVDAPETICGSSLEFLQYWYYLPGGDKRRLIYLTDPARALQIERTSEVDRSYDVLRRWVDVPIKPYADFLADHRDFRFYDSGGRGWLRKVIDGPDVDRTEIARTSRERLAQVHFREIRSDR